MAILRTVFEPPPDRIWVGMDFRQLELDIRKHERRSMILADSDRLPTGPLPSTDVDQLAKEPTTPLLIFLDAVADATVDPRVIAKCIGAFLATWISSLTSEFTDKFNQCWGLDNHGLGKNNWRGVRDQAYGEIRTEIAHVIREQFGLSMTGPPAGIILPWVAFGSERLSRQEISLLNMSMIHFLGMLDDKMRLGALTEQQEAERDRLKELMTKLSDLRMKAARAEEANRPTKTDSLPAIPPSPPDPDEGHFFGT